MPGDAALIDPGQDGVAGEFSTVVADHHPGLAALSHQPVQFPRDPGARERGVSHQRQALARAIIDHGQEAETAAIRELIRHEVERPAIVGGHRHHHRRPGPNGPLAAAPAAYRKPLFPVEPEEPLVVDQIALPLEQNMQASIAEATAHLGDCPHALAQGGILRPACLVSYGHAAAADGFTRPPFAHPVGTHEMRDSFPLGRGRHHFFPNRSFSAALSSMAFRSAGQDGGIYIERINGPFLHELKGTPRNTRALDLAIADGWTCLDESGPYGWLTEGGV